MNYIESRANLGKSGINIFAYVDTPYSDFLNEYALSGVFDVTAQKLVSPKLVMAYNPKVIESATYICGRAIITTNIKRHSVEYNLYIDKPDMIIVPYIYKNDVVFVPDEMKVWLEEPDIEDWWGNLDSNTWYEYKDLKYKDHLGKEKSIHGVDILAKDYKIEKEDDLSMTLVYEQGNNRIEACKNLEELIKVLRTKYKE